MEKFNLALRDVAFKYIPETIVDVGDIVETIWSNWKKSHKVKIYEIGIELVKLDTRARQENETVDEWLQNISLIGIDVYYLAIRLNKNGTPRDEIGSGIVLTNFITSNGHRWLKKHNGFNHVGLSWKIRSLEQ